MLGTLSLVARRMLIASLLCSFQVTLHTGRGTLPAYDTTRPPVVVALDTLPVAARPGASPAAMVLPDSAAQTADSTPVRPVTPADSAGAVTGVNHLDPLPGPLDMITNLPHDWYTYGRETFTVDNIPLIGGMAALTAGLVITDYESWQPFKKLYDRYSLFHDVSDAFVGVGDGKFQFGLAGLFGVYGFLTRDTTAIRTASQTVEVILACGAVVQLLKHLTGRESPFTATTPTGRWALFPNQVQYAKHVPHYDAFPSGHIATAFATLTVIMENYPEQKWIGWIGYPAIGMVGVALVATSIHWWSDIPLGLALGYSFGRLVSRHNRESDLPAGPELGLSVMPSGATGLGLTWRW
ncbi:MAG: phosphatase PAP2 family protein [Bacteroidetes bacterium]|nr:phosphatase PAP2 family protein [Bacteroidota bacterium]